MSPATPKLHPAVDPVSPTPPAAPLATHVEPLPSHLHHLRLYYALSLGLRLGLVAAIACLGGALWWEIRSAAETSKRALNNLDTRLGTIESEMDTVVRTEGITQELDAWKTNTAQDLLQEVRDELMHIRNTYEDIDGKQEQLAGIKKTLDRLQEHYPKVETIANAGTALTSARETIESATKTLDATLDKLATAIHHVNTGANELQAKANTFAFGEPPAIAFLVINSEKTRLDENYPAILRLGLKPVLDAPAQLDHMPRATTHLYVATGDHLYEPDLNDRQVLPLGSAFGTPDCLTEKALEALKKLITQAQENAPGKRYDRIIVVAGPTTRVENNFIKWAADEAIAVDAILLDIHNRSRETDFSYWGRTIGTLKGTVFSVTASEPKIAEGQERLAEQLKRAAERAIRWPVLNRAGGQR